jgi:hypothetical protein
LAREEEPNIARAVRHAIRYGLALVLATLFPLHSVAQAHEDFDISARNLLVVLRESHGHGKQDDSLPPFGKLRTTLPDGRGVQLQASGYQHLGDMHIRLVFDGAQPLQSASPADLSRLKLSPDEAPKLAVALYAGGAGVRPSSGLHLFRDGHGSVFQPPQTR